jgi:hypothetical protein
MAVWSVGIVRRVQGVLMIIPFPRTRRHRLASKEEAARSASTSAFKPLDFATLASRIDFHQSEGIESRCHHFLTAETDAPKSEAIPSFEGHSSITSRKEFGRTPMPDFLGQSVLKSKAKVSRAIRLEIADYAGTMDRMSETEEKAFFIGRTKAARIARFPTQGPICLILEIDQGTYKQYETRSPLPHRFIPKFCAATGVSTDWLLTGEGKGPRREEYIKYVPKLKNRPAVKKGRTRAA